MGCATFRDTRSIRSLTDSLSELAEDAQLFFEEEGLRIEAADPSLICKVEAFFSRSGFVEYGFTQRRKVAIDVESMARVTRRIRHEDTLSLSLAEGEMWVSLEGVVRRDFHNALIEPRQEELPKISLDFPATIEMDSSIFREVVKDVSVMGNTVLFSAGEAGFSLSTEGEMGKGRVEISKENPAIKKMEARIECAGKFNLGYLLSFLRASFVSEAVVISFGEKEMPLRMAFPFEESSYLTFYLAPMEF